MGFLKKDSVVRFSKIVVTYCMIFAPMFTASVMFFNWHGIEVQAEIILFMGIGFLAHLFSLSWVTVTKEKCQCQNGGDKDAGNNKLPDPDGVTGNHSANSG